MQGGTKIYGGVVVRLTDRLLLCKAPGFTTSDFSIPELMWAELVSKCDAPNMRTSSTMMANNATSSGSAAPQLSYHICTDNELAFAILSDMGLTRHKAHATLDEASKTFRKMFVESVASFTPKAVEVFVKPYRDLLLRSSDGGSSDDKVNKVKKAVDEVKEIALDNVERVMQRGQRIDDIVRSTEDLQLQAQGFQRSSRDLRQQMWWSSVKGKLLIAGVALFFILIVVFVFVGGKKEEKK
ncbi:synaptobrevin, putative [Trypanosoma brucei gambiense DAL972]|uniref:Vesicle-associated membrane protein, putative n=1 Tax=Trypanosoma brucei gambiense (strain MHOM/CI/86/DAL972) TaxID=679716 RepID=D0A159_TRYB9|nr:synaptobrevin, putative [Trypanosoma brucei gambiense DAL972]CBH15001.1 synaptobrevin, putative [Trypanosoma brucei gambiense DAL972]|eukprot:XP_011777267.1 synaptobrevin, putative [Trypanosoma brucei gambiense DAL972]